MPEREPEIVITPAEVRGQNYLDDEALDFLAGVLDDWFRVPGTAIRFGLDPLIGLIPGLGDFVTGLLSFLIVFAGWQRRIPRVTLLRMLANIGIDSLLGTVPVAGDFFDTVWKSNRMNLRLLQRAARNPRHPQSWRDWLFLFMLVTLALGIVLVPLLALLWIVHLFRK